MILPDCWTSSSVTICKTLSQHPKGKFTIVAYVKSNLKLESSNLEQFFLIQCFKEM